MKQHGHVMKQEGKGCLDVPFFGKINELCQEVDSGVKFPHMNLILSDFIVHQGKG
jgi:hypothetical protein